MSYYPPPGGQPPYQQQGYGPPQGPPPGQYPPQQQWGQYPPPNQGGYPPPNQGGYPPQGGYGPPPGQYNQGYHAPPGPPPPQQGFQQQQYPPNQGYGQPPPPGPGGYGQQPGGYPPQQNFGAPGPQAGPSPGFTIPPRPAPDHANFNAKQVADKLRRAMKGIGTDETVLITELARLHPDEVVSVKTRYHEVHKRDLMKDVHGETSGYFRDGLLGIIRGPLEQDCHSVHEAIKGIGTKESALNDTLLSRSNADMNAIKQKYHQLYGHSLESDVKGDLSLKTERLFDMVMAARRNDDSAPVIPQQIDADVNELYRATEGRSGADQIAVSQILSSRSDPQLRAISLAYKQKYHRTLEQVLRNEFSGHMEDAFLYMLHHAEDPAKLDADQLEAAMAGAGTKDTALVRRIIAVHWNPERLRQCKAAYKHFYKQDLAQRIRGETSGDYEKLMVECIKDSMGR